MPKLAEIAGIGKKGLFDKAKFVIDKFGDFIRDKESAYGFAHSFAEAVGPNVGEGPSIRARVGTAKDFNLSPDQFNKLPTLDSYTKRNKGRIRPKPVRDFLRDIEKKTNSIQNTQVTHKSHLTSISTTKEEEGMKLRLAF